MPIENGRGLMTPRERWGLLLIDERPDRPPTLPLITTHAATVFGCGLDVYCANGKVLAEAQLAARKRYRHDGFSVFTDVGLIAEAFGSRYHLRADDAPILDAPVLNDIRQADRLVQPDPGSSGRMPAILDAVHRLHLAAGDEVPTFAYIPCPFTTAAGLRGVDAWLMDTVLEPEAAEVVLELALEAAIRLADECVLAGALPVLVDPLASGSVISPRTFERFALPPTRRLIRHLHRYDLDVTLHICGDTSGLLDQIARTETDLFSFDQLPIATARQALGAKIRLVGAVPPHGLLRSSEIDVAAVGAAQGAEGLANPAGFAFATGCEVPIRCDPDKLAALVQVGKGLRYLTA